MTSDISSENSATVVVCQNCGYVLGKNKKKEHAVKYSVCPKCGFRFAKPVVVSALEEGSNGVVVEYDSLLETKND